MKTGFHSSVDSSPIPTHIAIIMDGNGRWAQNRGRVRTWGHREGAKRVDEIVTECVRLGVKHLTLYAFSTENWNRPSTEVRLLMRLLIEHLKTMDKKLVKNRVKLISQGSIEKLPANVQKELARVQASTNIENPAMHCCLCLSYGGREEIANAARLLAEEVARGERVPSSIDEQAIQSRLYHPHIPAPDLLIRTGGECRVSNFLLWQIAYSEIVVRQELWPEFNAEVLQQAIHEYSGRERRFGKTSHQIQTETGVLGHA